jgi:RNA polymerase sigma-70 factor, ECF subfamily
VTLAETDRALAERLRRGDAHAVDAFYRAHFDPIYQFVFFRVGRRREDAEDVTAETFLTALRRIGEFEGRAPLSAWLRGVARNKCRERNKLMARRRVASHHPIDAADLESLSDLEHRDVPHRALESEEVAQTVSAALSQIPEHYKRVLVSKYVDDLTFAEIAEKADCSAKAVESLVQRAKTAFGRVLKVMSARKQRSFHG